MGAAVMDDHQVEGESDDSQQDEHMAVAIPDEFLPITSQESEADHDSLFAAVRDYFAALATRQPVVLLLDDVHWADSASLDLLRILGRGLADETMRRIDGQARILQRDAGKIVGADAGGDGFLGEGGIVGAGKHHHRAGGRDGAYIFQGIAVGQGHVDDHQIGLGGIDRCGEISIQSPHHPRKTGT